MDARLPAIGGEGAAGGGPQGGPHDAARSRRGVGGRRVDRPRRELEAVGGGGRLLDVEVDVNVDGGARDRGVAVGGARGLIRLSSDWHSREERRNYRNLISHN